MRSRIPKRWTGWSSCRCRTRPRSPRTGDQPIKQGNITYARNFQKEGSENKLTAEGLAGWVKDPAEKPKYVEAFKRSDFAAMMNYYRANYPSSAGCGRDPSPNNPKINVPVLVIHGMKDQALLSMGHNDTWNQITKDTTC